MTRRLAIACAGLGSVIAVGLAATAQAQMHSGVHPAQAVVVQVIAAFDNPEAAVFSADGRFAFVGNAAEMGDRSDDFGWGEGEGYISKLAVTAAGTLEMVEEKLIDGLTAPLGMGVLPVSTGTFPAGTIFACVGSALMRDADGNVITDRAHMRSKLLAFDVDGNILGEIDTGGGSVFEEINGSPIALINALAFDAHGNLYVADTAFGADQFDPPWEGKGGMWTIPVESLDDLAAGRAPTTPPSFLAVPGFPDGIEVSPIDGKIYINTVGPIAGAPDPAGGGIYAIEPGATTLPAPFDSQLGALDGLDFTARGTMINTQIKADRGIRLIVNCPGEVATTLEIEPPVELDGPADIDIGARTAHGQLVLIPELTARDDTPGDDEVTVILLPPNFDAACAM